MTGVHQLLGWLSQKSDDNLCMHWLPFKIVRMPEFSLLFDSQPKNRCKAHLQYSICMGGKTVLGKGEFLHLYSGKFEMVAVRGKDHAKGCS